MIILKFIDQIVVDGNSVKGAVCVAVQTLIITLWENDFLEGKLYFRSFAKLSDFVSQRSIWHLVEWAVKWLDNSGIEPQNRELNDACAAQEAQEKVLTREFDDEVDDQKHWYWKQHHLNDFGELHP